MNKKTLFALLFITLQISLFSQDLQFYGNKFHHYWSRDDYHSSSQIWTITQDARGVMFFGTSSGIVWFDGTNWNDYSIDGKVIRSLTTDDNGRVYVGAGGEFGYLEPDSVGEMQFTSLNNLLPDSIEFNDVWQTIVKNDTVFFITSNSIFIFNNNKIDIINDRITSKFGFKINSKVYFTKFPAGLSTLEGDTLIPLKGISEITPLYGFFNCVEYGKDTLLFISTSTGMYLYDTKKDTAMNFIADDDIFNYIKSNNGYTLIKISDNEFAMATLYGGIIIFDKKGKIINIYNTKKGLETDCIYSLFLDKNKNLWAGTQKGIIEIEISSPITYYDKNQNMNSYCMDPLVFNDKLYLGTLDALFLLKDYKFSLVDNNHSFVQVENTQSTWDLLNFDNFLFSAGRSGLFLIEDSTAKNIYVSDTYILSLASSSKIKDYIFLGRKDGLQAAKFDKNTKKITNLYDFSEIPEYEILKILQDTAGDLWLSTYNHGIVYVHFLDDSISHHTTTFFNEKYFPSIQDINVALVDGDIKILTAKGIYKPIFNSNEPDSLTHFVHDEYFGKSFTQDSMPIQDLIKINDTTFFVSGDSLGLYTINNGNYKYFHYPFKRISGISEIVKYGNNLFISSPRNFNVFNLDNKKNYKTSYNTIITKVNINSDSTIFYGNFYSLGNDSAKIIATNQTDNFIPTLSFKENAISFEFSALDFQDEDHTEYSYILENFDTKWRDFSDEQKAVYTNLHEGKYIFKVKARNIYDNVSTIATYQFEILPPWYRTWWAYSIFIILGLILLFIIIKLYTLRLKRANIKLEQIVQERTSEITQQKEEIMAQAEELQAINEELHKLTIVAEKTNNAVIIFDENLNFEWGNAAFERIYGTAGKSYNLLENSSLSDIDEVIDKINNVNEPYIYESRFIDENREIKWLQTTLTPVLNSDKKLVKIIAIETDITEIKQKNELIKNSLNYAKTIQATILPTKDELSKFFNYDIIFRPKDVVSGDFYWFTTIRTNDDFTDYETLLVVADCTGHGVPGAFMSLISSRLLNEIVNYQKITSPAEILSQLSKKTVEALKQEQGQNNDGMDVIICKFSKKKDEDFTHITFAGAKRPLFYCQNGEYTRLKGDIATIGGISKTKNKVFTNKELEMHKDDIIYLLSDGYIDQNNEKRRKIGSKNFTSTLDEIKDLEISEQIKFLEQKLDKWQQNTFQRDDITVVGIKF